MKTANLFLFFILSINVNYSQVTTSFIFRTSPDNSTILVSNNGLNTKKFTEGEKLILVEKPLNFFNYSEFSVYDFVNGYLPVKKDDIWYLIDQKGDEKINFGKKYDAISIPSMGIYRAFEIEPDGNAYYMCYINQDGQELYGGDRYWNATPVRDEIAYVQPEKDGYWIQLNFKSGNSKKIFADKGIKIENIKHVSNDKFIAVIKNEHKLKTEILMNIDGKILINPANYIKINFDKHNDNSMKSPEYDDVFIIEHVFNDHMICSHGYRYFTLWDNGTFMQYDGLSPSIAGISNELILLNNNYVEPNFLNHKWEIFQPKEAANGDFICDVLNDQYYCGGLIDTVNNTIHYAVFDSKTHELLIKTDKRAYIIDKDLLMFKSPHDLKISPMDTIKNFKGEVIYVHPPEERVFTNYSSLKDVDPEKIIHLNIDGDEKMFNLDPYINLKTLSVRFTNWEKLPNLNNLKQLEHIELVYNSNLNVYVHTFENNHKLNHIGVNSCPKIVDLESIIISMPSITKVSTTNYNFRSNFFKSIESTRPNIEFISGFSFFEIGE